MNGTEGPPEQGESGIDLQAALAMAGGDKGLLRDLARAFLEEVPELLRSLRAAVAHHDPESVKMVSHQIQGVMRCLHAQAALEQAARLEQLAEGIPDWPTIAEGLSELNSTIDSAVQTLNAFLSVQESS